MNIWINEKTHTVYVEDAGKKFTSYAVHSAMIHYIKEYTKKTRTPYEGVTAPKYNRENMTWKASIV